MKKGRKGRGQDGVWTREPNGDTQKQIDAGMIEKRQVVVEGTVKGYTLHPVTVVAAMADRVRTKKLTKKAAIGDLQDRLTKTIGKRQELRYQAAIRQVEGLAAGKTETKSASAAD